MRIQKIPRNPCRFCNKDCARPRQIYCCISCQVRFQSHERAINGNLRRQSLRKYLMRVRGIRCQICGLTEWHGKDAPLIMDHISGNSEDNSLENVRLVCANCDMHLPTYKIKNKGNGRAYRRERYAKGLSY